MVAEPLPTSLISIRVAAVRTPLAPPAQFQAIRANDDVAPAAKAATVDSLSECLRTEEGAAPSGAALWVPVIAA